MRTINIYKFTELDNDAQRKAVLNLRGDYINSQATLNWEEANETIDDVLLFTGLHIECNNSSQGWYVDKSYDKRGDSHDEQRWQALKDYVNADSYTTRVFDYDMRDFINKHEYYGKRSFLWNVECVMLEFVKYVDNLAYKEATDENVADMIINLDYEFFADGSLYTD